MHLTVTEADAGSRLDRFLARALADYSRTFFARLIESGKVAINGQKEMRPRRVIRSGDSVEVDFPPPSPSDIQPEEIPLDIVFEDDWLAVVVKPAGMIVHPGAGRKSATMVNALAHRFGRLSQRDPTRPGIVHRLDRDTSGLLLVAKSERAHYKLARQFQRREVEKQYLALVFGTGLDLHGKIDAPIGRHHLHRTRMAVTRTGRAAVTLYDELEILPEFTYLRVTPKTGRTHQIRVHLAHKNHPIVGDMVYGGGRLQTVKNLEIRNRLKELNRLFLHATFLRFCHPKTGEVVQFESPLPADLEELVLFIRAHSQR
jgi:23S rRNA pseudouridine1911/1915/1917 synthase